jgi:hypothetical protein
MRLVELGLAVVFVVLGIRSTWKWTRRPIEGTDVTDHVLYAVFVTGRAGLWFALAGYFLIAASIAVRGRAAMDELARFRWYVLVPLVLAVMQLVAGYALGRRSPGTGPEGDGLSRRP